MITKPTHIVQSLSDSQANFIIILYKIFSLSPTFGKCRKFVRFYRIELNVLASVVLFSFRPKKLIMCFQ